MMSEEKIPPHIHPFNFFIVKRLDEIWSDIAKGYPNDAVKKLFHFTLFLEPKIQQKLGPLLKDAEKYFKNEKLPAENFAVRFLSELTSCLHEEGYFAQAKRQIITSETFDRLESEDVTE